MRFVVDENAGPAVAHWLKSHGHEVFSVYHEARGIDDEAIIHKAYHEHWILITGDKDFGEKVYRERFPHHGVILLRLQDERPLVKIETLTRLLKQYEANLTDHFIVVTENRVRFARKR
jgi:predicted nuclease of predicted toxin-antitoxin system